jgi:hypothetical protein
MKGPFIRSLEHNYYHEQPHSANGKKTASPLLNRQFKRSLVERIRGKIEIEEKRRAMIS